MADSNILRHQEILRATIRCARKTLTRPQREIASEKIADTVLRSAWFQRSRFVACYLSTRYEVDTWPIIARAWRMKKRIFAPVLEKNSKMQFREVTSDSTLETNQHGILTPQYGNLIDPRRLDLVITPLVAFDKDCNRIGMGGGYFDRTFAFMKHREHLYHPKLVGVAFACQQVEKITANPWDIRLFSVVSDS